MLVFLLDERPGVRKQNITYLFYDLEAKRETLKITADHISFLFCLLAESKTHLVFQTFASDEGIIGKEGTEKWVQYSLPTEEYISV